MQLETKKTTIADIAKLAGVSKTTVSRYINGHSEFMSSETAERLEQIIRETEYIPSNLARSLKNKKTRMIGVIIASLSSPFSAAVMMGIGNVLEKNGYTPLFVNADDRPEVEIRFLHSLIEKNVDGLIVNATRTTCPELIHAARLGMPIVLCDREVQNHTFDIVMSENRNMVFQAIAHLKEQGYNRVALFSQNWEHSSTRQKRLLFYQEALQYHFNQINTPDIYLVEDSAMNPLEQYLSSLGHSDIPAILCSNSETTLLTNYAIQMKGLSMPQEIGLCGADDWEAWMSWPEILRTSITTMDIQARQIAEQAATLLLEKLEHKSDETRQIVVPGGLTVRDSSRRLNPKTA